MARYNYHGHLYHGVNSHIQNNSTKFYNWFKRPHHGHSCRFEHELGVWTNAFLKQMNETHYAWTIGSSITFSPKLPPRVTWCTKNVHGLLLAGWGVMGWHKQAHCGLEVYLSVVEEPKHQPVRRSETTARISNDPNTRGSIGTLHSYVMIARED